MGNSMKIPQKVKNKTHMIQQPYFWVSREVKERKKKTISICIPMFFAALFTKAKAYNIWLRR